jgi:hypothetical protein
MSTSNKKQNVKKQKAAPAAESDVTSRKKSVSLGWAQGIFISALAVIQFFFLWKIIRPELYFTAQEPVFFLDRYFFKSFTLYPAGLLDYGAAFVAHLNYVPWLGALVLSLLNTGIVLFFRTYVKKLISTDPLFLYGLPLAVLLLLQNNYLHSPIINLALFLALGLAMCHTFFDRDWTRAAFFVIVGGVFYYAAGASLFIFGVLALLFEIVKKRNFILPLIYVIFTALVPYLSGSRWFAISLAQAFSYPVLSEKTVSPGPLLLYAAMMVTPLLAWAASKLRFITRPLPLIIQAFVIAVVIFTIPLFTLDSSMKQFWQFNYLARTGEWQKVLQLCEKPYIKNQQVSWQINRALCHTGMLNNRMFFYQQPFGREGLFVLDDYAMSTALIRSDLYFDLGNYNAAKQWAHEATSVRGETMWNLQRLALTYLILGQNQAAEIYFKKLERTLFLKKWAERFRPYWSGKADMRRDSFLAPLLANRVDKDFVTFPTVPEQDLPHLLEKNPRNRFAFEYLMADLLLSKKISRFVDELRKRQLLDRPDLPRPYQEALLFYIAQSKDEAADLKTFKPNKEIVEQFRKFQLMVMQHRNDLQNVRSQFEAEFRQTYWFYIIFHQAEKGA